MTAKPLTCVIGAGLAGLTAAYRLQQAGQRVQLFEASNRLGGRVYSVLLNGSLVELGGQSIFDGDPATHILNLIAELGLETEGIQVEFAPRKCLIDGTQFAMRDRIATHRLSPDTLYDTLEKLSQSSANLEALLQALFPQDSALRQVLSVCLACYEGGPVHRLSPRLLETLYSLLSRGFPRHSGHAFDRRWVKGGNARLTEALALALGDQLFLGRALVSVEKQEDERIKLSFGNGSHVICDRVILACPPPCYAQIKVDDRLVSVNQWESMKQIAFGVNSKIICPSSSPIGSSTTCLLRNLVLYSPDGVSPYATLYYADPDLPENPDDYAVQYARDRSALEAMIGTRLSREAPRLPPSQQFENSSTPIYMNWNHQPFTQGSYSYLAAEQETQYTELTTYKGESVKRLFAPIEDRLFFAGEHTTTLIDIAGTMEAAVESGERMARAVMR